MGSMGSRGRKTGAASKRIVILVDPKGPFYDVLKLTRLALDPLAGTKLEATRQHHAGPAQFHNSFGAVINTFA